MEDVYVIRMLQWAQRAYDGRDASLDGSSRDRIAVGHAAGYWCRYRDLVIGLVHTGYSPRHDEALRAQFLKYELQGIVNDVRKRLPLACARVSYRTKGQPDPSNRTYPSWQALDDDMERFRRNKNDLLHALGGKGDAK